MIYQGDYGLADLRDTVDEAVRKLAPFAGLRFDSIAVTGLSGSLVGPAVALALSVPVVAIRKPSDMHHGSATLVGFEDVGRRYLIIDDFRSTGATVNRIRDEVAGHAKTHGLRCPKYAGVYLYGNTPSKRLRWAVGRPLKAA